MSTTITRREFIRMFGAGCLLALGGPAPVRSAGSAKARVVVIGGGFGGATAAKYLRLLDPGIEVTLIERNSQYVSCPLSNEVIVGERDIAQLTFGYEGLTAHGVSVVQDEATGIDPVNKTVATASGTSHAYDRLIVAPGIDFKWDTVEGYSEEVSGQMPHAYKAGEQTLLLKQQIEAMRDGGLVVIVPPPKPFRCPPGPYERASLIAHYLTQHKPKSKIIILDPNSSFSKKGLFEQAWEEQYGDMITWVPGATDGIVQRVDAATSTLYTEFSEHKADVISFIPPHHAGHIAQQSGLADDSGWCPVDPMSMESTLQEGIHVLGDACIAGEPAPFDMPKSAHAANSQAKVAAGAIVAALNDKPIPQPYYVNTCYSLVNPEYGISVVHIFRVENAAFVYVKGAGGTSPLDAKPWIRKAEAGFAVSWFENITRDSFS